jgi:uncharacterized RDD family membrane protein YckC
MTAPLDTDVAIETPEHIVFHHRVAGPARRALAQLIDLLVCYGAVALLAALLFFAVIGGGGLDGDLSGAGKASGGLILLALFCAQWLYFATWEALTGRTPGKMALGLRVTTTSGRPIGVRAAVLRNLLRAADLLPTAYLLGVFSMALTARFQRIGDLVAGTMVVVPERARAAKPLELSPPAHPQELRDLPDLVVLDADEREAIELFLRRRNTLGRAREHELASIVCEPLAARLGYRHPDPSRLLALVYDRAVNAGRADAPPSSWNPRARTGPSWR